MIDKELLEKTNVIVTEWANQAVEDMRTLLRERSSSGDDSMLSQSINFNGSKVTATGVQLQWDIDDYYIYIDLGVRGLANKSRTYTSEEIPAGFQFRNMYTPPQMINSLKNYISRSGIPLHPVEGQSTLDALVGTAFSMAKAIKVKGITGTKFYSDVFNQKGFQKLTDKLEGVLGESISIKIVSSLKDKI